MILTISPLAAPNCRYHTSDQWDFYVGGLEAEKLR